MESSSTTLAVRSGSKDEGGERRTKELAEDDILEILARLPVKSLLRFKSVSKTWYSLIISPNFISIHCAHSLRKNKVSLLVYSCKKNYPPGRFVWKLKTTASFGFGDVTEHLSFRGYLYQSEIVGCFNGVICLSLSQRPQKYALWNPATRQLREIGDAPIICSNRTDRELIHNGGWYGSGFCYDPVTNAFKVAQIRLTVTEAGETMAQVHLFSTATNSWTGKNLHVPFRIKIGGRLTTKRAATCVNGCMHWHIALLQDHRTMDLPISFKVEEMYILSYNINDEVFQRFEMPFPPAFVYYHLATYEGSLAMFVRNQTGSAGSFNEFDVWVLNYCGAGNHSCSKLLTCKPSIKVGFGFAIGFFRKDDVNLVLFCEEPDCKLYLYDHDKGETKEFGKEACRTQTFLYSESLVSFN